MLLEKKNKFNKELISKLYKFSDSKEFWLIINKFRKKVPNRNVIDLRVYPPRVQLDVEFLNVLEPILDTPITFFEIKSSLKHSKNGKSPGPIGISNEFFKNLPDNWILYLTSLFNKIFGDERFPSSWAKIIATMLYKKGDPRRPENYRYIALINSLTKLFTRILNSRLNKWLDFTKLILECQSGFRKGRSCTDNVLIDTLDSKKNIMTYIL